MLAGKWIWLLSNCHPAETGSSSPGRPKVFDGTWQAVSGKLGTASIPLPETQLRIEGERYVVESGQGIDRGTLHWGPEAEYRQLDMTGTAGDHRGHRIEAIVRVKGDLMQLCYAVDGSARPQSFETRTGTAVVTVRYRRVTDGQA